MNTICPFVNAFLIRPTLGKLLELWDHARFSLLPAATNTGTFEQLNIHDSRTDRQYRIPIVDNSIQATDLGQISTGSESNLVNHMHNGLKVLDPGFSNTAVMKSHITFVYVGSLCCKSKIPRHIHQ